MRPLTLALSPSGGEGIETPPSPSARERVGVRGAHVFTHSADQRHSSTESVVWYAQPMMRQ